MTKATIKAEPAPPVSNMPAWYGLYFKDGAWHRVCNKNGNPIVYVAAHYAIEAAVWELNR